MLPIIVDNCKDLNNSARLLEAIDLLEEAVKRTQREKATAPLVKKLEGQIAKAFKAQGKNFAKRIAALEKEWPVAEASNGPEWEKYFDAAAGATVSFFQGPIDAAIQRALAAGGMQVLANLKAGISFNLKNPRAVAYIKNHGAEMVTKINETTRAEINRIIAKAVDEGWSYARTARAISDKYSEFAVGRPQAHIETRAHMISVTETGNAYVRGELEAARQMAAAGIPMEKSWDTVGDDRVSEGCALNGLQGYIPLESRFDSGDDAPLRFPGCRCALGIRVKREPKTKAKAA